MGTVYINTRYQIASYHLLGCTSCLISKPIKTAKWKLCFNVARLQKEFAVHAVNMVRASLTYHAAEDQVCLCPNGQLCLHSCMHAQN